MTDSTNGIDLEKLTQLVTSIADRMGVKDISISYGVQSNSVIVIVPPSVVPQLHKNIINAHLVVADNDVRVMEITPDAIQKFVRNEYKIEDIDSVIMLDTLPRQTHTTNKHFETQSTNLYKKHLQSEHARIRYNQNKRLRCMIRTKHK